MPIDAATLDPDPVVQLERWLVEATDAGLPLPNAFALATADGDGMPSVRYVLLQGIDPDGLRFFTNRSSRKRRDRAVHPRAAAAFWWAAGERCADCGTRLYKRSLRTRPLVRDLQTPGRSQWKPRLVNTQQRSQRRVGLTT